MTRPISPATIDTTTICGVLEPPVTGRLVGGVGFGGTVVATGRVETGDVVGAGCVVEGATDDDVGTAVVVVETI
jgi:hypothetical protein